MLVKIEVILCPCSGLSSSLHGMASNMRAYAFCGASAASRLLRDSVELGEESVRAAGLSNVTFKLQDVAAMDHEGQFDVVTAFDTVHDQAKPDALLAGITRALKPGGTFLMSDIKASTHLENNLDHPLGTFGYAISCMHCMTVSLAYDGMGLGAMWGGGKSQGDDRGGRHGGG